MSTPFRKERQRHRRQCERRERRRLRRHRGERGGGEAARADAAGADRRGGDRGRAAAHYGFGPAPATRKVLERRGLSLGEIDLSNSTRPSPRRRSRWSATSACGRRRAREPERGAIALGHPLGMSGARMGADGRARVAPARGALCPGHHVHRRRAGDRDGADNGCRGDAPRAAPRCAEGAPTRRRRICNTRPVPPQFGHSPLWTRPVPPHSGQTASPVCAAPGRPRRPGLRMFVSRRSRAGLPAIVSAAIASSRALLLPDCQRPGAAPVPR